MKTRFIILFGMLLSLPTFSWGAEEGMTHMPKIKPKNSYIVQSNEKGEDIQDQRGFGEKEPMVRMMNLMMVEGSGYEGMDMNDGMMKASDHKMDHAGHMQMAANEKRPSEEASASATSYKYEIQTTPAQAKAGANTVMISIQDAKTGKPVKGLKPKAQVSMTSMDMGTDEPRVREVAPGKYQIKATFSMKGPWAVKLILPQEEKVFNVDVQSSK